MRGDATSKQGIRPRPLIAERYQDSPEQLQRLQARFLAEGYVKLPGFLVPDAYRLIEAEVSRLHATRIRKDFVMPGFRTDRKMSVLAGKDVVRRSEAIARLYACGELRNWIAALVGTDIHAVLHDEEFLVLNFLDGENDTHGWHLDDPRYALIVVVECPSESSGGRIEYVPEWRRIARQEGFDPHQAVDLGVDICRRKGLLRSDVLAAGDCYLLDAGEVLHRVSPMGVGGRRKALNLAFDDRRYRVFGQTAARLYG